jgi:hypothetical protein
MHALDTIDLLLQRNCDRRLHYLRVRTHVVAGNGHLWRRQVRIEGDRQARDADRAGKNDQQGADCGKNRPPNEKINQIPCPLVRDCAAALLVSEILG